MRTCYCNHLSNQALAYWSLTITLLPYTRSGAEVDKFLDLETPVYGAYCNLDGVLRVSASQPAHGACVCSAIIILATLMARYIR